MDIKDSKELFEEAKSLRDKFRAECTSDGSDKALQHISRALKEIQKIRPDVRLEIFGDCSKEAFAMFNSECTIPISGILHIGHIQKLFAVATRQKSNPVLKFALSSFDIRFQGASTDVKSIIFDLAGDPDALKEFQTDVIFHCARNDVVDENDVAKAFATPELPEEIKPVILKSLRP